MAWTERYVDASAIGLGSGTSPADPWTLDEARLNVSAGMRVNIKAGVYSITSNTAVNTSGSADLPIWFRGYKTTPGDLDDTFTGNKTNGTDIPQIRSTTGYYMITCQYFNISGLAFTSNNTGRPAIYDRRYYSWAKNCRFYHEVQTTVASSANDANGESQSFVNCEFGSYDPTNTGAGIHDSTQRASYHNCVFYTVTADRSRGVLPKISSFDSCVFYNMKNGIDMQEWSSIRNCTFVDITGDAIICSDVGQRSGSAILNNYFYNIGGHIVGNPSLVSTDAQATLLFANNCIYNSPNKFANNGDMPELNTLTDSSDEFVDKANGDYTLKSSSSGYGAGLGGYWSFPMTDYSDAGAVQHADPSGGGGGGSIFHPLAQ